MEKPNSQLKDCFDGYFQEAVEMSFEQDESKMPFFLWLFQLCLLFLQRSYTGWGEKEELFVNIWYSQTWAP